MMKIDILGYNHGNVGSLYGFNQYCWLIERGHSVNYFNPITWHMNTDSDILLMWEMDQLDINFNRDKYRYLIYFTITSIYSRFAQQDIRKLHESRIDTLKPDVICYMCKEDLILSPFKNKLLFCNNKFADLRPTPWLDKYDGLIFAGKSRPQIDLIRNIFTTRLMYYPPLSFQMDESLIYYDMFRFTLCPLAGHLFHQRVYNAALVGSIPIIIIPDRFTELHWFPELINGTNCLIVRDTDKNISEIMQVATTEMAENITHVLKNYNFDLSMGELMNRMT
jgi:hypothetical protein